MHAECECTYNHVCGSACVCVCVCACVRACVRVCVRVISQECCQSLILPADVFCLVVPLTSSFMFITEHYLSIFVQVDQYFTVQPHTIMRQHLNYSHWYEISTKTF